MAKKKRFKNFNNWGTAFALLISGLALTVSIYQTKLMTIQQKATVWPYLHIAKNYKLENFELELFNNGTGPAVIKSVEVSVNNKPVESYFDMFDVINPDHQINLDSLKITRISEQVIRSGESRSLLSIPWSEKAREITDRMDDINIKVHYCSVLDECWLYDFQANKRNKGKFKARLEFQN